MEININYLRTMFLQIIEGVFQDEQPDLGNYSEFIQEFAEMLNTKEAYSEFRTGLKGVMQYAILHPEKLELNKIFREATGVYLDDDMRVHALIKLAWHEIFPGEETVSAPFKNEAVAIVDLEVEF